MVRQMKTDCNTGTSNEQQDLISAIYHSLQSASVYNMYIQDANHAGNRELLEFFQQGKEQISFTTQLRQILRS